MSQWRAVCKLEEIPRQRARVLEAIDIHIAVFRTEDDRLFAVENRCPHRGAPLSSGLLYDGDKVACLDHGWSLCLTDGKVVAPETGGVRTFEVKVEDGVVYVAA
jgi:nitrite reductase (NADH) small subunit